MNDVPSAGIWNGSPQYADCVVLYRSSLMSRTTVRHIVRKPDVKLTEPGWLVQTDSINILCIYRRARLIGLRPSFEQ